MRNRSDGLYLRKPEEEIFYVYSLRDPSDNRKPFYIGKGKLNRAASHLKTPKINNKAKHKKILDIRALGLEPEVFIEKDKMTNSQACDKEIELIAFYGRSYKDENGILTNILPGGEGILPGEDHPNYGVKRSPEIVEKIRLKNIGRTGNSGQKNGMFGRKRTEKEKLAISIARTGKKETLESKKIRSENIKKSYTIKNIDRYVEIFKWYDTGMPTKYICLEVGCHEDMVFKAIKERLYIEEIINGGSFAE